MFLLYLWGIETCLKGRIRPLVNSFYFTYEELKPSCGFTSLGVPVPFLLYLWGIETPRIPCPCPGHQHVFTLPMRNWNLCGRISRLSNMRVFTLPMRNWNLANPKRRRKMKLSFYFTYEELKRRGTVISCLSVQMFLLYLWGIETISSGSYKRFYSAFLLYLWGIETRLNSSWTRKTAYSFYFNYEELKLYWVGIISAFTALFLLYLWGIETYNSHRI